MKRLKRGDRFADLNEVKKDIEVKYLSQLKHDAIIKIHDVVYNSTDRTGFIILPYCEKSLL